MPSNGKRKKDSARLVWDTKPRRAPNPRDIEFQTAEVVIPNWQRDNTQLPLAFQDGNLADQELDKSRMNRLIWGDNLLAMQALLAQGYEGKINLIYIDPPFDSKADYSHRMTIEGTEVTKEPSVIERLAYKDTWAGGIDSYLDMLYPRLQLMKRLLANDGSIYIHLDPGVGHFVRVILDEVFGRDNFRASIVWQRTTAHANVFNSFGKIQDLIFFYTRSEKFKWSTQYSSYSQDHIENSYRNIEPVTGRRFALRDLTASMSRASRGQLYEWKGIRPPATRCWAYTKSQMEQFESQGRIVYSKMGYPRLRMYLDEMPGVPLQDIWTDIGPVQSQSKERLDFETQKPFDLIARILKTSTEPGDLIADFFIGSGTTVAVAEKLGRRWIGVELGKVGIQVSRSRLVQQDARPFLIENIGNYQREMIYLSGGRIGEMQRVILKLYGATPRPQSADLGTRKNSDDGVLELVYVGYPDRPVTARKAEELAKLAQTLDGAGYKRLVILAWDYDYNYSTELENRLKAAKSPIQTQIESRAIPPDIYDYLKKVKDEADIEPLRDKVQFHEKPYLRLSAPKMATASDGKVTVMIGLDKYVVFDFPVAESEREKLQALVKDNFAVLIDYWAVDWDCDGRTFRSQWQDLRGNGRKTKVVQTQASTELATGKTYTIAVRVVDVFGNDATAICKLDLTSRQPQSR